ncbi:hypothetical protein MAUB1S_04197 [Mycolicibacterium aubagnense]
MNIGPVYLTLLHEFMKLEMNDACVALSTTEVGSPYSVAQILLAAIACCDHLLMDRRQLVDRRHRPVRRAISEGHLVLVRMEGQRVEIALSSGVVHGLDI